MTRLHVCVSATDWRTSSRPQSRPRSPLLVPSISLTEATSHCDKLYKPCNLPRHKRLHTRLTQCDVSSTESPWSSCFIFFYNFPLHMQIIQVVFTVRKIVKSAKKFSGKFGKHRPASGRPRQVLGVFAGYRGSKLIAFKNVLRDVS